MKNLSLLLTLTFCVALATKAQVYPTWISKGHFPDASSSTAYAVAIDPSGNILSAGSAAHNYVVKYDASGNMLWLQTYDCGDTISEAPRTLCVDNQGNAYITFMKHTLGGTYWAIAIQKYDAENGTLLWTTELPESQFNGFEWRVRPKYMTIDNNNLYVAGTKFETGTSIRDILTMKLDFDGNILWTATHSGNGTTVDYSNAKSITVDNNGNVYVAGDAWNASIDYCVVKYDPNGNLLWDAFLDNEISQNTDIAESICVDDNGSVYVTGYSHISISGGEDILTAKYNQNGTLQWKQYYGSPDYRTNNAYYLTVSENNELYVGGYSSQVPSPGTGKDYVLLKYDQNGNFLWDARYDYNNFWDDHPFDFDIGPNGNIYICGISRKKDCYIYNHITAVKYNSQGEMQWDVRMPNLYGIPWGIKAINEDEFVVAAGAFDSTQVHDATVIHYETAIPPNYEAEISDVYFEAQLSPPEIDAENRRIIATVHDTANLEYLLPYISRSEYACMYPEDEVVTSFVEPVWYNVTSFDDEIEKWWYLIVEGGYVGTDDIWQGELVVYPNPADKAIHLQSSVFIQQSAVFEILDVNGRKVLQKNLKSGNETVEVDLSQVEVGVYCYRLIVNSSMISDILIVQRRR